jgi:hypothetical protein
MSQNTVYPNFNIFGGQHSATLDEDSEQLKANW